jgi:hypothetical protein
MRTISALFLVTCLGCRAAAPEPPEPVDHRPWCEQEGHEWAAPPEAAPEPAPEPELAIAMLGFASIDKSMIRRVIEEHRGAIDQCYALALRYDPNLEGRLSVRFVIEPDGRVGEIDLADDTLTDPCVGRCVIAAGKQLWQFPRIPGAGTITINYPFNFIPD